MHYKNIKCFLTKFYIYNCHLHFNGQKNQSGLNNYIFDMCWPALHELFCLKKTTIVETQVNMQKLVQQQKFAPLLRVHIKKNSRLLLYSIFLVLSFVL